MTHPREPARPVWASRSYLSRLEAPARDALLRSGHARVLEAGETLVLQGQPASTVGVVVEGRLSRTRIEPNGEMVMLALHYPGDLVGELSFIDHGAHSATVAARDRSVVRVFTHAAFEGFLRQYPSARSQLLRTLVDGLHEAEAHRSDAGVYDVERRLARALLRQVDRYPCKLNGHYLVELRQRELAMLIGAQEGTVQKALASPLLRDLVRSNRGRILLGDIRRLAKFAEIGVADGCFSPDDM